MLVLASKSPRRREILSRLGVDFDICPASGGEAAPNGEPDKYVVSLALEKAREVAKSRPGDIIIGADTIVCLDGDILGKPKNTDEARRYLRRLSGREHTVYTGLALIESGREHTLCEATEVFFRRISDKLIDDYIASGEPMDKAGAYGIQGAGGRFVEGIRGDFFNVMGLPLCALSRLMEGLDIIPGGEKDEAL